MSWRCGSALGGTQTGSQQSRAVVLNCHSPTSCVSGVSHMAFAGHFFLQWHTGCLDFMTSRDHLGSEMSWYLEYERNLESSSAGPKLAHCLTLYTLQARNGLYNFTWFVKKKLYFMQSKII